MAVLSLPLSFTNSFWSQDYRKGLEVLYGKLEQGIAENAEIVTFIRARAAAEASIAASLTKTPAISPQGFGADDGASLFMAFQGLQAESARQGEVHNAIAKELQSLVAEPFEVWARGFQDRVDESREDMLEGHLRSYEHAQSEVAKLKHQYLNKTRKADEAEDDARFAPGANGATDNYTTSPRLSATGAPNRTPRAPPNRTPSVSERIANRLKDIQRKTAANLAAREDGDSAKDKEIDKLEMTPEMKASDDDKKPLLSKVDKGKGKATNEEHEIPPAPEETGSPPPLSPPLPPQKLSIRPPPPGSPMPPLPPSPILVAGISLPPAAISALLTRAAAELPLRPVRFPLIGEYKDCFSGEEFVTWLNENVEAFGGSLDRAEDAAKDLAEREGLLRRVGEFGNMFENADDAFYQFRPKAFELDKTRAHKPDNLASPTKNTLAPIADSFVKRSGTFVNLVSRAMQANTNGTQEPPYVRLRHDAEAADRQYRVAVRKLDRQRLGLEERIEETLKRLQRWETDRLRAVKTVLLQYQGTLANLPKGIEGSLETSATLIASYQPESDLTALIERYRTGPFRPTPQVYESVVHDEADVVFGIDLRKWAEGGWSAIMNGEEKKELVPPVLSALLKAVSEGYANAPNDAEKRKTWIYEVPLAAVHHLRESLNGVPIDQPIPAGVLAKYDPPVLASAIKLWALELDPPLALYEGWDEIRKIYPPVGSAKAEGESTEKKLENLHNALMRLPKVHLYVLDAILSHLKSLIDSTTAEESNEVYITKLALTLGRTICRPRQETSISIQDRHPTQFFMDLLKYYDQLLPPTITKKKRESERKVPIRKRTAPIDMRMHRSRLSVGSDVREQLAAVETGKKLPPVVAPEPVRPPVIPEVVNTPADPAIPAPTEMAEATVRPVAGAPAPAAAPAPSPAPALAPLDRDAPPPRPHFKEPPPEDDDLPPRPNFKEPPPEILPESEPSAAVVDATPASPPATSPTKPSTPTSAGIAAAAKSRSPSPRTSTPVSPNPVDGASLSRHTSTDSSRLRGPRGARGPRGPGVSNIVANLNRQSMSGPGSPPAPATPQSAKRLSRSPPPNQKGDTAVKRLSRTGAFSRRTVASDAEDELVGK
ncbi:hypothetical protein PUNSTDRAFT_145491 [Punctularia strigosozonata HHB-11173 SS5]|uniref:uncharacterized protein n=1 Tax=Punctularia strigosozonata (strain HHB-11173) TaxID=741275 RepID=UPI00044165A5|nr:uncharacterized protein PUNSTDRAFT_145491 [Punctularia strigosozonata HHB-11173 SS5]EIN06168.1 hypothetical protein PUNSTDRAFT_145491 [Punctularia strigosozonata HHB-11173 SS5]